MQCQTLTAARRRCPNDAAPGQPFCLAHLDPHTRLVALQPHATEAAPRSRKLLTRLLKSDGVVPDPAHYDVPDAFKDLATARVIEILRGDEDSMARWTAAYVLRKRRAVAAIPALWETLQLEPVRHVRQQSAVALGKIAVPGVVAPLVESLNHDVDAGVRQACAIALGNLGWPALADEVARVLERETSLFVRWDCILALGALGDRRHEALLVRLEREERTGVVRDACRDALDEIRRRARVPLQ